MEELNALLELIIAIAGVVISLFEIKKNKKEKEKEKELRDTEAKIVALVNNSAIDNAKIQLEEKIIETERNLDDIDKFQSSAEDFLNTYVNFLKDIERLYTRLLQDEANFSLSYGFERYINVFRKILNSDQAVDGVRKELDYFSDLNDGMFSADANICTRKSIFKSVEHLIKIWNKHPDFSSEDVIEYRVCLMQKQYPGYTRNYNQVEEAVYIYFEKYYAFKKAVMNLMQEFNEILPYIKELKIKYDQLEN